MYDNTDGIIINCCIFIGEWYERLFNTGRMLDRHDGTNDETSDNSNDNQTTVSFDNADDLLDDMK